jgi:hypothetical protein
MGTDDEKGSAGASNFAVWALDDPNKNNSGQKEGTVKTPILNACLALTKHLMSCRPKSHIQGVICSRFNLDALKEARKIICTYNNTEPYAYRGPNKVPNIRDKSIHAFDGIFDKLMELDANDIMPTIACPSEDMGLLLSLHNDPIKVDDRFRSLEEDIRGLRHTLQTVMRSVSSNPDHPTLQQASAIQPNMRARLNSESSKRRRTEEGEVAGSESDSELQMEGEFTLPPAQLKRLNRRTYSGQVRNGSTSAEKDKPTGADKKTSRPKAIWGKSDTVTKEHLSGPPPEIFMMNCSLHIKEENVKQHFVSLGINVLEVEKKSHEKARKNSFVITPSAREDYDKIMSGDHLPRDVGVRQYFRRRYQPTTVTSKAVSDFLVSSPGGSYNSSAGSSRPQVQNSSDDTSQHDGGH